MKKMFYVVGCFLGLMSCSSNDAHSKDKNFQDAIKVKPSNIQQVKPKTKENNVETEFKQFISMFNKNCDFQKKSVEFPLQFISLTDFAEESYDTSFINLKDYECMRFTEPKSDIMEGKIMLSYLFPSLDHASIQLQVEDTGVHILYIFEKKEGSWFLIRVLDEST